MEKIYELETNSTDDYESLKNYESKLKNLEDWINNMNRLREPFVIPNNMRWPTLAPNSSISFSQAFSESKPSLFRDADLDRPIRYLQY